MAAVVSKCGRASKVFGVCCLLVLLGLLVYIFGKWGNVCASTDPSQIVSSDNTENQNVPIGLTITKLPSEVLAFFCPWTNADLTNKIEEVECTKTLVGTAWEILSMHLVTDLLAVITQYVTSVKEVVSTCTRPSLFSTLNIPVFISVGISFVSLCLILLLIYKHRQNSQIKMKGDLLYESSGTRIRDKPFANGNETYCNKLCLAASRHGFRDERKDLTKHYSAMTLRGWSRGWVCLLIVTVISISIPWEFLRLYQKAVAERASRVLMGTPPECSPPTMSLYQSLKSLLKSQFSWSHGEDACHSYHYAILVDPLWEVTPLMVLSSLFTRCLLHPLELTCSSLGRSFKAFFSEIPAQWQPFIMVVAMVTMLIVLLMLFRYRLSIPMILRIEPKSPAQNSAQDKLNRTQTYASKEAKIECLCSRKFVSSLEPTDTTDRPVLNDLYSPIWRPHQPISNLSTTSLSYLHKNLIKDQSPIRERNGENILTSKRLQDLNTNYSQDVRYQQNCHTVSQNYLASSASDINLKKDREKLERRGIQSNLCKNRSTTSRKLDTVGSENNIPKQTVRKYRRTKTLSKKKITDTLWTPKGDVIIVSDSD